MDSRFTTLQKFYQKYWPDITESQIQKMANVITMQTLKKGEIWLSPGEVCDYIGIINYGIIRYYTMAEKKEHIGQIYFEDQAVTDYSSYFTGKPSRIFMDAVKETEIAVVYKKDLQKLINEDMVYHKMMFDYLSLIYINNFERTVSLLLDSAETRYLKLLTTRPEIIQRVPLYMVASYLGITPEALSRVRSKIAHTGA